MFSGHGKGVDVEIETKGLSELFGGIKSFCKDIGLLMISTLGF